MDRKCLRFTFCVHAKALLIQLLPVGFFDYEKIEVMAEAIFSLFDKEKQEQVCFACNAYFELSFAL